MPRQIEPGDLVEIIINNEEEDEIAYYQVDSISDRGIMVSNNDSPEWLIFNPDKRSKNELVRIWGEFRPHQIKFLSPPTLTGDPNVDLKILLYLDDQSLSAYCQINPDDCTPELWQTKIIDKWGVDIYHLKPKDLSAQEYYLRLLDLVKLIYSYRKAEYTDKFDNISKFVENGDFYIVNVLDSLGISHNSFLMTEISNAAIYFGRTDVLDWLWSTGYNEFNWPVNGGHVNVLEWFRQHDLPVRIAGTLYPDIDYIPVLEWLDGKIENYSTIIFAASRAGRIDVLDWLYDRGHVNRFNVRGSTDESFDWFISKQIYPDTYGIITLAEEGELAKLQLLAEKGILPVKDAANKALEHDRKETVKWMLELGISPKQRTIDSYFLSYPFNSKRAELLAELSLWPSSESADIVMSNSRNVYYNAEDHLDWLYHHNIYPSNVNPSWMEKLFHKYGKYRIRLVPKKPDSQ